MKKAAPLCSGDKAPIFSTTDQQGRVISHKNLMGQKYLLYFYPRDNTPGCTAQACGFRDLWKEFKKKKTTILGISGDSAESHQKFVRKYELPFPLLMDEDNEIARAFGVWGEKKFMGKTYEGIHRTSFLINESGQIEKAYHKVKAKENPAETLTDL